MALIKLGIIVTDIRGAIGGVVFSRNKSGAIARKRTTPFNPKSVLQEAIRAIMSFVVQLYKTGLTSAQKAEWAVFAKNTDAKNKLGETIKLSGYNQFVKSNVAAKNAGLPEILDGPATFILPGEDPTLSVSVSEASQTLQVTFDDTRDWVDENGSGMLIYMGIPQDDSIDFFNGPWRYADVILGDDTTPPTAPETIACPFPVVEGQKIFTKARIIKADGRLSDDFQSIAIAGA